MGVNKCVFAVIAAVLLALSCSDDPVSPNNMTDAQAVDADMEALTIIYASGDSAGSITANVTLPTTGVYGSHISWHSLDSVTMTSAGVVNRPAAASGDKSILLVATITKGNESRSATLSVTIKARAASIPTNPAATYWAIQAGLLSCIVLNGDKTCTFLSFDKVTYYGTYVYDTQTVTCTLPNYGTKVFRRSGYNLIFGDGSSSVVYYGPTP